MSAFKVEIPDEVLEDYDDQIAVMDAIAEALQDEFGAKKVKVSELPWG